MSDNQRTDYPCPPEIEAYFATEELATDIGRRLHIAWIAGLPLNRGDRVEVFGENGKEWWVYDR